MNWHTFLVIAHIIGTSLGVGGVTLSDLYFFKILKRGKISEDTLGLLKTISFAIWIGLIILTLSGFGFLILLRLTKPELGVLYSPKLWAKLGIVAIVLFNGLIMHWKVFPLLESNVGKSLNSPEFSKKAWMAFTTGAVSFVSWYSALILGAWRTDFSFLTISTAYLTLVAGAIIIINIVGYYLIKKSAKI